MQRLVGRILMLVTCCAMVMMMSGASVAQTGYYTHGNLVSNLAGKAPHQDGFLKNPWGLVYAPGGPFWVSDEASGWSTLYNGQGVPQSLQLIVPMANGTGLGTPTGIVYNGSAEFKIDNWPSLFIYCTLDGSLQGWSHFNPGSTLVGVTESGASYTGLAITSRTSGNLLYAADAANNRVDVFNGSFSLVNSFNDPTIPQGFAPFGIQDIGGQLYVTFASTTGGKGGYVDIFNEDGTFVKRFSSNIALNQPWGLAVAPSKFGPLSGTLLVSNNTASGTIHGFDLKTGKLVGVIKDINGKPIAIPGLWGIEFGGGTANNGHTNQLFYTAGPNDTNGFFGVINAH